jgi:uncharacterized protein YrrD
MPDYEVDIGAQVRSRDGKRLGSVERLIVHADTRRVDGFLLDTGILSANKIVGLGQIANIDSEGITLTLNRHEAEALPSEIHEQMLRAPGNLTYEGRFGAMAEVEGTGDNWVFRGPTGGDLPNTGASSFFFEAPIGNIEAENISSLSDDLVIISEKTEVVGSDGQKIGHVDEVILDNKSGITSFLVRAGHLFQHDVRVPISAVAGMSHARVRLNIPADEVGRMSAES